MTENEKVDSLYDNIVKCSQSAKLQIIASQLSELIHLHKHEKVGDEYILSMLCAMRNAIWDSKDSDDSNWHTGIPTEGGWYLIKYKHIGEIRYIAMEDPSSWVFTSDTTIGWQKIEIYEERKE